MTDEDSLATARVGLVTGGGSGIGAATVRRLAGDGIRVLVADADAGAAEVVAGQVRGAGGEAAAQRCDVRDPAQVGAARDECHRRWGRLDVVVANAGLGDSAPVAGGDPARWRAVVETNVLGTIHTARAALESMAAAGHGDIVVVASLSGRVAYAGEPVYLATKWASVGFGHSLRMEAQRAGVRVTLVEPGLVDTPLARANAYAAPLFASIQPLAPEDVADAIAYALSCPPHVLVRELALQPMHQEL